MVLFNVEKNTKPPGLTKLAQALIIDAGQVRAILQR